MKSADMAGLEKKNGGPVPAVGDKRGNGPVGPFPVACAIRG